MNSKNPQRDDEPSDFRALEARLRAMPPAVPPADLLNRLQADIPAARSLVTADRLSQTVQRVCWTVAAAAVLLIGVSLLATRHAESLDEAVLPKNILRRVYLDRSQDTNPCSILPPFPPLPPLQSSSRS
jgi:hypothetical protein